MSWSFVSLVGQVPERRCELLFGGPVRDPRHLTATNHYLVPAGGKNHSSFYNYQPKRVCVRTDLEPRPKHRCSPRFGANHKGGSRV